MANVNIRNLSITLGQNAIIKNLNLDVIESEFLVLLGPSGCGKSTLLHSIAGLIDVTDGTIEIGGEDMTWADPTDRHIGMVFQSYALYPTMTVERNMSFGLRINGTPKPEIEKRVKRAAEILHLEPLLKRKPSQLSGGQRQRVAIGRALVREAGVYLFDEPLSNLDAKLRSELRRELKLLHKSLHSTMIYVTHDQVEAMTLGTRLAVMRDGSIQQLGTPAEVYSKPANLFVAGFLGAPSMNFFKGMIEPDGSSYRFSADHLKVSVSDYDFKEKPSNDLPVVLGIRPEHIDITNSGDLEGVVSLIEPMGNHHVIWIDHKGVTLSAILNDLVEFEVDGPIRFSFQMDKVSLFGLVGELRL